MTNAMEHPEFPPENPERRLHFRRKPTSLAYVEMGEYNGGIVLNLSESGLAIQAAMAITGEHLSRVRFQVPPEWNWVSVNGQMTWLGESKKEAGIRFLDLPESARVGIRDWISLEGSTQEFEEEKAALWKNERGQLESSANRDPAFQGAALDDAQKEDFWTPHPPGVRPHVPRETNHPHMFVGLPSILQEDQPDNQTVQSGKSGNGWKIGATVVLTAVISLVAGIGIGNGSLPRWLRNAEKSIQNMGDQTGASESAVGYTVPEDLTSPSQDAQAKQLDHSSSSPQASVLENSAPSSSPDLDGVDRGTAEAQPRYDAANSLTLSADQPQSGILISAPEFGAPSLRLNLPPKALSASSSIAISSQRSLVVPPISQDASQRTERLQIGDLMYFVEPVYPAEAKQKQTEGTVELHTKISLEGEVGNVRLVSGSPLLAQAAINAISGWRYRPTLLGGRPIETEDDISMVFRLP